MSTRKDIVDHEAAYHPHSYTCKPGIVKFNTVRRVIQDPAKLGWQVIVGDNGEPVYYFYTCVIAQKMNDKIRFGFKVIPADEQPFDGKFGHLHH